MSHRGAFAAVVTLMATIAVAAGSSADGVASTAAPRAAAQAAVELTLVDQTPWVHAGDEFSVNVRVDGAPAGAGLELVVHERLQSRSGFQRTLDGEVGGTQATMGPRPLAELGPVGQPLAAGFVVGGDAGEGLGGTGVYPVDVQVVDAQGVVLDSLLTHLVYLPTTEQTEASGYVPLAVAVVVDVSAPPALQPDGTIVVTDRALERARERVALLTDAATVPLTVAPLPETLDGFADRDRQGAEVVDALAQAAARRPVLARPYTDIDLGELEQAGLIGEANAQAEAGADVVRQRFGQEPVPGIWLSGPTLGADATELAVDLGIGQALVPPSAIEEQSGISGPVPDAPVTLGDGGALAMVSDDELLTHLTGDDGVLGGQRFLAELAIMWLERPATQRAVAVHIPGDVALDRAAAARGLNGLTGGQAAHPLTLDDLFASVAPLADDTDDGSTTVAVASHEASGDLSAIAGSVERARDEVSGVARTVGNEAAGASLARSLLLATGSTTPGDQRRAYVDRVTTELGTLSEAIELPDEFRITLTSRTSTIPVNITNRSDQPLKVRVELSSSQLEFPDGDVISTELQPGGTRLEVPVRILTSGAFPLDITVTSPDGSIELDRTTFDVRSTAVTGVGLLLSIGAGLFLAVWWARHWRRTRRSRHLMPAGSAPAPTAADRGAGDAGLAPADTGNPDDAGYHPAHMAAPRSRSS
jgi:hypothetical protein